MKILIDINHPAHVHYFKNFIRIMENKGHKIKVINRDSQMINQLLDIYRIEHKTRNRRPQNKGTWLSLIYLMGIIGHCIRVSLSFKPDMYVGFASSACAITSFLFRRPCILIDDTEHNGMNHALYKPFCSVVLTPFYFSKHLGKKQIYFNAFVEQFYLHSRYFNANKDVLEELDAEPEKYVLVRYIAYDAHHDLVAHPLSVDSKKEILQQLSKHYRVFLSIENGTSEDFYSPYIIKISPEKMHDVEANAKFMISEGATMASESFILGVPYAYINPLKVGNIGYQTANYPEWAFQSNEENTVKKCIEQLSLYESDNKFARTEIESKTIDSTAFFVWFVENYPNSHTVMKENPNYQFNFISSSNMKGNTI